MAISSPARLRSRKLERSTSLPIIFRPRVLLSVALIVGLVYAAWRGYRAWQDSRAEVVVQDAAGGPLGDTVTLEFFEFDERIAAASPTRQIRAIEAIGERTVVGTTEVPGEALVRVRSPRNGTGFGVIQLGGEPQPIRLGAPVAYSSRVVSRAITDSIDRPVAFARVIALGGGQRGVVLGEAVTDSDGNFVIDSVSDTVLFVTFRVLASDFAVFEHEHRVGAPLDTPFRLERTSPVRGVVESPDGVDLSDCEIRVVRVPGVVAEIGDDGAFEVEHLPPPPLKCRLVIADLPAGWTHRMCLVSAGSRDAVLSIERSVTVTGVVADAMSSKVVMGASVYHDHGPSGIEVVACDSAGHYLIERVPHGTVRLRADRLVEKKWIDLLGRHRRKQLFQGSFDLQIHGETERIDDVVLLIQP